MIKYRPHSNDAGGLLTFCKAVWLHKGGYKKTNASLDLLNGYFVITTLYRGVEVAGRGGLGFEWAVFVYPPHVAAS